MKGAAIFLLLLPLVHIHKTHAVELDTISDSQFLTDGDTLVSRTGFFELGVFRPGSSDNRYVGIWYKKIPGTVVWVANRDHPITGASPIVLKIDDQGSLILSNNISTIWSSNLTTPSPKATAKLEDTGNLVVMDQRERIIWQSFDYPTDTLLPGMKLGKDYLRSKEWHLSAWKNNQNPSPGDFTWGADTLGYPENKLKQGPQVTFRGGPWSNQRFSGISAFNSSLTFTYKFYPVKNNLNSSGLLESSVWVENGTKWQLALSLPRDICDRYNICSAYASCSINMIQQSVLVWMKKRFVPRDQKSWERADWSGGCVRRTPLDCKNGSEGFIKYSNIRLPDTEKTWFNMSMSLEECEAKCLKNCSCMAYANPDTSLQGRGCLLWFDDLFDIRGYSVGNGGQDIFVRMASSELVAESNMKKKGGANIKIILPVAIIGVLLMGCSRHGCCTHEEKGIMPREVRKLCNITIDWSYLTKRNQTRYFLYKFSWFTCVGKSLHENNEEDIQLPLFSFSTIANATASFSEKNVLGEGGFGPVYKIAVKRLSKTSSQGVNEFKNEVICISKLQHRNLVKLLGCCIEGDERLLIYEYMPNKGLDSFIFARSFGGNEPQAKHTELLAHSKFGYMAPEYALDGVFSTKSDVFSFGVLGARDCEWEENRGFIHPENDHNLVGHAWNVYNEGRSMELLDESIAESCSPPEVLRSIQVGLLCVQQMQEIDQTFFCNHDAWRRERVAKS
uniref:Receptor-like serine/threonine-protein kinase n=1 Tax=Helianthus annuus TaxID=4232 RepID=A0A251TCA5_HELAN